MHRVRGKHAALEGEREAAGVWREVLKRLTDYDLRAAFSGHFHGFTEKTSGHATLTTNRCCALSKGNHDGTKEKGYFLMTVKDGKLSREFVEVKAG